MADIFNEIDKILSVEVPERHTFFQLKFFVLGAEPTIQAKYQCCLRELRTRRLSLDNMNRELEDLRDQTALLRLQLEEALKAPHSDDPYTGLEASIELRSLQRHIQNNERIMNEVQRKMKYTLEECQFFVSAYKELEDQEPLRPFDLLEVQQEYWDAKLGRELKTRLIVGQPLDSELVKAIEELHDTAQTKQQILILMQRQEEFNKANGIPMPEIMQKD